MGGDLGGEVEYIGFVVVFVVYVGKIVFVGYVGVDVGGGVGGYVVY